MNSITVKQIAEKAGVSIGSVSHVLNRSTNVSESLREKVEKAIEELGYQPSRLARGLRRQTTDLIGVIVPDITNPFFPSVVRGAEDTAFSQGFRLVLCNTDNDPSKELGYVRDLRGFQAAGLLAIPCGENEMLHEIEQAGFHTVFLDRCPRRWKGDLVTTDNEGGAYAAVRHLILQGHKNIAFIGPSNIASGRDRLAGFHRALTESGITVPPQYVQDAPFHLDSAMGITRRIMGLIPRPTAIFATNDILAAGVILALREMGLKCPEDVSIVGFDNLDFSSMMAPALTTVHQSGYQMGSIACRQLIERIHGSTDEAKVVVLPTELRVRDSTGPVLRGEEEGAGAPYSLVNQG